MGQYLNSTLINRYVCKMGPNPCGYQLETIALRVCMGIFCVHQYDAKIMQQCKNNPKKSSLFNLTY